MTVPSPAPEAVALRRIGQIAVAVKDVDRAVAFYRDALGAPFAFQVPGMAFFQCGEISLMLAVPSAAEFDHPSSVVYFDVPDVQQAYATLQARGVPFRDAPHVVHRDGARELWMAFFRDPDGNTHAIRCWRS